MPTLRCRRWQRHAWSHDAFPPQRVGCSPCISLVTALDRQLQRGAQEGAVGCWLRRASVCVRVCVCVCGVGAIREIVPAAHHRLENDGSFDQQERANDVTPLPGGSATSLCLSSLEPQDAIDWFNRWEQLDNTRQVSPLC